MKKTIILTSSIAATLGAQAAVITSFDLTDHARLTSGTASAGYTASGSEVLDGSFVSTFSYSIVGNFDGDAIADTFTFTIVASRDDGLAWNNDVEYVISAPTTMTISSALAGTTSDGSTYTDFSLDLTSITKTGGATINFDNGSDPVFSPSGNATVAAPASFDASNLALTSSSGTPQITLMDFAIEVTTESVPEPSSTALLGLGAVALLARRRR